MKGLDTNVLVRLLTGDNPRQQDQAKKYVGAHCTAEDPGFVNRVVLVEVVWVLDSAYHYARDQIASAVEALLRTQELTVEDAASAWAALKAYRDGADFADALICFSNEQAGCAQTVTFDGRAAKRLPQFEVLRAT